MSWDEVLDRVEKRNAFNERLSHMPSAWRRAIVDVIDTFEIVKQGLDVFGINDSLVLTEAVRMVIDRHDKELPPEPEGEP